MTFQTTGDYYDQVAREAGRGPDIILHENAQIDESEIFLVGCTGYFLDPRRILFDSRKMEGIGHQLPVYEARDWMGTFQGSFILSATAPSSPHEGHNDRLRDASGQITSSDPLVSFLYELMRDHLTVGQVEQLVRNCPPGQKVLFTNGWLAQIALDQADRLRE